MRAVLFLLVAASLRGSGMRISKLRAALAALLIGAVSIAPGKAFALSQGNLYTGQVTVTSANTVVVPVRTGRSLVVIINLGTTALYCGSNKSLSAGVTASNGQLLTGAVGASLTWDTAAEIDCISAGASQAVSFSETF